MKRSIDAGPDDCPVLVQGQEQWTGGFYVCGESLPCSEHRSTVPDLMAALERSLVEARQARANHKRGES